MSNPTYFSLFSGGELAGVGAMAAGFEPIGGVEIDARISEVARRNGFDLTVADVTAVEPSQFPAPDLLHASPECTRASVANPSAPEDERDINAARKVSEFIRVMMPHFVTVENVVGYRRFESFRIIIAALAECGYMYDVQILNAADFGVPQSRRRLFVRAVRGGFVPFLARSEWRVGWYEAIADLLDDLPASRFADWQKKCLPAEVQTCLVGQQMYGETVQNAPSSAPAFTLTANSNQSANRAFLLSGENAGSMRPRGIGETMTAISASSKSAHRVWTESGRVVKLTPRALARLSSVPDWYELPETVTLANKIIGNGIPPLMYQKIAEAFVR